MTTFKCSNCDYYSKTKNCVKQHIEKVCTEAEIICDGVKVKCDICNKEYGTEKYLKAHKKLCIEKKCVVVEKLENSQVMSEKLSTLFGLITSLTKQIGKYETDNNELKKEVNTLTRRIKVLEEHKARNGTQPLSEEERQLGDGCSYVNKITFKPTSYENMQEMHSIHGLELDSVATVMLNGETIERDADVYDEYLMCQGVRYYFDKKNITRNDIMHCSKLKVVLFKYCGVVATTRNNKGLFCEEHS